MNVRQRVELLVYCSPWGRFATGAQRIILSFALTGVNMNTSYAWRSFRVALLLVLALGFLVLATAQESRVKSKDTGTTAADAGNVRSFEVPRLKLTLVRIEAGEFQMGSPNDEASHQPDEEQHAVKLSKAFYIQSTEVSQQQYEDVMGENPSYFKGGDLPVENVSWAQAAAFCYELSRREGRRFRLPTEAEWEYAARAGKPGPVAGTGKLEEMARYADNSGKANLDSAKLWDTSPNDYFQRLAANGCRTRAVGTGTPNDWGLHDMQGNVTEWVGDWYSKAYFTTDAARVDPRGPAKSDRGSRVMRGGSWGSDPRNCRVAARDYNVPKSASASRGFRIAMDAE
jgi:formylglycine-generating enzyme required for sulfatase activity